MEEELFHSHLGRAIQAWLWVEGELYSLFALLMRGANSHLVSATFNNVQSVDAKLTLLNSCLALVLSKDDANWKQWRALLNKADKLNKKRNKIVHEPVVVSFAQGQRTIAISPSHFNSLALAKGQTTHKGAVVTPSYQPTQAKVLVDHTIDLPGLYRLENAFKAFSFELRAFSDHVEPTIATALAAARQARRTKGAA